MVSSSSSTAAAAKRLTRTSGLPLVGSLPQLLHDPFRFLTQAHATYGDLYRLNLGLMDVVVLNHPRQVQHVFIDQVQNYRKGGGFWDSLRLLLGNGLVVSEGDFWLRQRRMMQPQFHRQRLAALTEVMVKAIDEALDIWAQTPTPQAFNLPVAFNALTMKVVTRTLFGTALTPPEMEEIGHALNFVVDYIFKAILFNALPAWVPAPGRQQYLASIATIDRYVYKIIAAARQNQGDQNHLLAMLLDLADENDGQRMTDRQLRDEVMTLFAAGYETTSVALTWAFEFLGYQPALRAKLEAEVDGVLGNRKPTFADVPQLNYTYRVLQETMRLRPPAWQLTRTALRDDTIDGYPIPAGTTMLALIYMCHHHPAEWPNPEQFDPDRFLPDQANKRHSLAWMPFGAGQRLCIGRDFALLEGPLALAMVTQRFHITARTPCPPPPQMAATLRPKGGMVVQIAPR